MHDQLVQVILNLVLNAADATEAGGRIVLSAERAGDALILRVEDDGTGIAAADRDRLFQPYFTTKSGGTGLGLPTARRLIVEHGGTLTVESEVGRGTTFMVRLPVGAGEA